LATQFDHLVSTGKQRRRTFTAEHKIATPVNWKPGEDAIIAGSMTD
jgi:alkyl hydroperoxide reductase subunit AhpC